MYQLCDMDISKSIRAIREDKRLTQLEVAEKLQMERSNYARLEARGNKLSVEQLEQIAGVLGVSLIELLTGEAPKVDDSNRVKELIEEIEGLKVTLSDSRKLTLSTERRLTHLINVLNQGATDIQELLYNVFEEEVINEPKETIIEVAKITITTVIDMLRMYSKSEGFLVVSESLFETASKAIDAFLKSKASKE